MLTMGTASAEIENPSFETGNTNGWTQTLNGGAIEVVEVCDSGCAGSSFAPYDPVDGDEFALLTAGAADSPVTLSQEFSVLPGSTITGWAFFCDGEDDPGCVSTFPLFTDTGEVRFSSGAVDVAVFSANNDTGWTAFTFVVPGQGCSEVDVTIAASVTNGTDSGFPSRLGLDAIVVDDEEQVEDCATPTPTETQRPRMTPTATRPPNIGAGLSGLFVGQPTPLPTAPSAVAPAATAPTISPPRTGDAGLADESSAPLYGIAAAGIALAVISAHRFVRR